MAGACADSAVALGRIGQFLLAEEQEEPYTIRPDAELAIDVEGNFTWETAHTGQASVEVQPDVTKNPDKNGEPPPSKDDKAEETEKGEEDEGKKGEQKDGRGWFGRKGKGKSQPVLPTEASKESEKEEKKEEKAEEKPFQLNDLDFKVPKGAFVVVLGPVGSGKVCVTYAQLSRSGANMNAELSDAGPYWRDAQAEGTCEYCHSDCRCIS